MFFQRLNTTWTLWSIIAATDANVSVKWDEGGRYQQQHLRPVVSSRCVGPFCRPVVSARMCERGRTFVCFTHRYAAVKRSSLSFVTVTFKSFLKLGGSIYQRRPGPTAYTHTPPHTLSHGHTHPPLIGCWTNHWPSLCNLWGRSAGHSSM